MTPKLSGREKCIQNDFRIGDLLKHSVHKFTSDYTEMAIITAIGRRDVMLMNPNGMQEEWISDLEGEWELINRPTQIEDKSNYETLRTALEKLYEAANKAHNCRDYYEKDQPDARLPGGGIDCIILNEAAEALGSKK